MTEEERDLMPLDPERDFVRWERMIGAVMTAAAPELRHRAAAGSPLLLLGGWPLPTLAASGLVTAFAAAAILYLGGAVDTPTDATLGIDQGIGLPTPVADWLHTGRPEALDALVFVMEG